MTTNTAPTCSSAEHRAARPYNQIDLSSTAFWSSTAAEREHTFAHLRATCPVSWHRRFQSVEAALVPEVLSRMKDMELAGPVERMPSTLINGIHSIPVRFMPARPVADRYPTRSPG
jgi:hypothetical protein